MQRIAILALAVSLVWSARVNAQERIGEFPSIAELVGQDVQQIVDSVARGRQATEVFSREIAAARAAFWEQYPNGPTLKAAEAKFVRYLAEKDLIMAAPYLTTRRSCFDNAARALGAVMGNTTVDGGIAPQVGDAYCVWVDAALRVRISDLIASSISALFALPEYAAYTKERDFRGVLPSRQVSVRPEERLPEVLRPHVVPRRAHVATQPGRSDFAP